MKNECMRTKIALRMYLQSTKHQSGDSVPPVDVASLTLSSYRWLMCLRTCSRSASVSTTMIPRGTAGYHNNKTITTIINIKLIHSTIVIENMMLKI